MTLSKLMRDVGLDGVQCGFHTSAQNSVKLWPVAARFYGRLRAEMP